MSLSARTLALPRLLTRQTASKASSYSTSYTRNYSSTLQSTLKLSSIPAPHAGSITIVSLNRPKARNALSRTLISELSEVVEGIHAEKGKGSTRALILASESDQAFCAGADLKERLGMSPEE